MLMAGRGQVKVGWIEVVAFEELRNVPAFTIKGLGSLRPPLFGPATPPPPEIMFVPIDLGAN